MEKTIMTQKELDTLLRNITTEEFELLKVHDENASQILKQIRDKKLLIESIKVSVALKKQQYDEAVREHRNIKLRYRNKRKELLESVQTSEGINSKIKTDLTRHQCFVVRRLFHDALVAELGNHPSVNTEHVEVNFNLTDEGQLYFRVYIPSLEKE